MKNIKNPKVLRKVSILLTTVSLFIIMVATNVFAAPVTAFDTNDAVPSPSVFATNNATETDSVAVSEQETISQICAVIKQIVTSEVKSATSASHDNLEDVLTNQINDRLDEIDQVAFNAVQSEVSEQVKLLKESIYNDVKAELKTELYNSLKTTISDELYTELKNTLKDELYAEIKSEIKSELTKELTESIKGDLRAEVKSEVQGNILSGILNELSKGLNAEDESAENSSVVTEDIPEIFEPQLSLCYLTMPQAQTIINSVNANSVNTDYIYSYTYSEQVSSLALCFSTDTSLVGNDYINIWYENEFNGNGSYGTLYGTYSKNELSGKTILLACNSFRIEFVNYSNSSWFEISSITANTDRFSYSIKNGEATVVSYTKFDGDTETVIPSSLPDGTPVVAIGKNVFSYGKSCNTVIIPSSIRHIEENAFFFCFNITELRVDSLESWFNIDFDSAYSNPMANRQGDFKFYVNNVITDSITVPASIDVLKPFCIYQMELESFDTNKVSTIMADAINYSYIYQFNVRSNVTNIEDYVCIYDVSGVTASDRCKIIVDYRDTPIDIDSILSHNTDIYCLNLSNLMNKVVLGTPVSEYRLNRLTQSTVYEYNCPKGMWHAYTATINGNTIEFDCVECSGSKSFAY